jgi:hypothetical protein
MLVQRTMSEEMSAHNCFRPLAPELAVSAQHLDIVSAHANFSTQSPRKLSPSNLDGAVADLLVIAKAESSRSLRSSSW